MMSPIDKLLAMEEIKQLKARYFRFVDSHDWAGFRGLFAEDATFEVIRPMGLLKNYGMDERIEGVDAIVAYASGGLKDAHSVHSGAMPEIEILASDSARGLWAMEDIVRWPGRALHGHGYYRETYVRHGDKWLFKSVVLIRKSVKVEDLSTVGERIV